MYRNIIRGSAARPRGEESKDDSEVEEGGMLRTECRHRRIFEVIEVEDQLAGFVEPVGWESGVEEAASAVCRGGAGGVAKDEEELGDGEIFEDGLKLVSLAGELEFRGARNRLRVAGANQRYELDGLGRGVGNPASGDAIGSVRRVPGEAVEGDQGARLCILDAQRKAFAAVNDVDVKRSDGHARIAFVIVGVGVKRLRLGGLAIDEESFREAAGSGWRIERDDRALQVENAEMTWAVSRETDLVPGRRAE